jgi:hypothetical protein
VSRALLTADVLRAQQSTAPIRSVRTRTIAEDDSTAKVAVSYTLRYPSSTTPVATEIALHKDGTTWRMDGTAIATAVHFAQAGDRALILGGAVPSGESLFFPGALPVSFDTNYLALDPTKSAVDFGTGATFSAGVELTAAGERSVANAVDVALSACLATPDAATTCPLPQGTVPGTLRADLTSDVARAAHVVLLDDASGTVGVTGTAGFTGSYDELDAENIPQQKSGSGNLPLTSWIYLSNPLTVVWGART